MPPSTYSVPRLSMPALMPPALVSVPLLPSSPLPPSPPEQRSASSMPDDARRFLERGRAAENELAAWGREYGLVVFDDVDRAPSKIFGLFVGTVRDSPRVIGLSAHDRRQDLSPPSSSSSRSSLPSRSSSPHLVAPSSSTIRQPIGRLRTTVPDLPYLNNIVTNMADRVPRRGDPLPQFRGSHYYQQSLRVPPDRGDTGLPFRLEWHEKWWHKAADPLQNYSAIGLRTWMRQQRRMAAPLRMSAFMYHLNRYVLPHLDVATARQLRCAREFFAELAEYVEPAQLWFDPFVAENGRVARAPIEAGAAATGTAVTTTSAPETFRVRVDGDGEGRPPLRVFRLAALLSRVTIGRDGDAGDEDGDRRARSRAAYDRQARGDDGGGGGGDGGPKVDVGAAERAAECDGLLRDLVQYEWLDGADLDVEAFEFEPRRHAIYQSTCAALALEKRDAIAATLAGTALYPPPLVRLVIDYNAVARHAPTGEVAPNRAKIAPLSVGSADAFDASSLPSSSSPTLSVPPPLFSPRVGE